MRRTVATRLADKLEAMAELRSTWLASGVRPLSYSPGAMRNERDDLLKASVELRRLAARPKGKKKQSKVGA